MPAEHEQNRRSWNAVTPAHQSHKADQGKFFREGGSTLFEDEVVWSFRALTKRSVTWGDSYFQRGAILETGGVSD